MPDYYTQFSFVVELEDEAQADWLIQKLSEAPCEDDENEVCSLCEAEKQRDNRVWIHDDGGQGDLDGIIDILCLLQETFPNDEVISFQWSFDCSRPLDDAYGGGAAVVYKGEKYVITTGSWIYKKLIKLGKDAW